MCAMALSSASSLPRHHPSPGPSAPQPKFRFSSSEGTSILGRRSKRYMFPIVVSATKNAKEVTMVDPLEAKRLAEKQMQQIQEKEKYKRKREIEAINGGWAMIGLTAGLVIEGHTGNGILKQLKKMMPVKISVGFLLGCNCGNLVSLRLALMSTTGELPQV